LKRARAAVTLALKQQREGASMRRIVPVLCALAALAAPAAAQDSAPSRPVRLVVSFPPGGGVDAVARLFADRMSALLGQTVVVENRGGASGIIAGKQVASAEPDGSSVLIASNSMVVAQVMSPNVGLDIARDLKALVSVAPQAIIITAPPDLPANTLGELIALAKTRRLNYGSPGAGSVPHLLGVYLLGSLAGVTLEHIPFPGAAQALTALLGKQIDLAMVTLSPAVTLVADGKMKGIVVTTPQRSATLPQVPTAAESGYPGFSVSVWTGFFVPARTPKPIADRLEAAVLKVANEPEIKAKLAQLGFEPTSIPGEQFQRDVVAELKRWDEVVEKAGIKGK
jgi:tripartite-type tricarboxylate transporter receptor subunit TctC